MTTTALNGTKPEVANPLTGIAEVVECRPMSANQYLSRGYRLLGIEGVTKEVPSSQPGKDSRPWIQRKLIYVVGRPSGVAHFEAPRMAPRPQGQRPAAPTQRPEGVSAPPRPTAAPTAPAPQRPQGPASRPSSGIAKAMAGIKVVK
jgi:hypothetical protein